MAQIKTAQLSNNNFIILMSLGALIAIGVTGVAAYSMIKTIQRDTKVLTMKNDASIQLTKNLEAAPKLVSAYDSLGQRGIISDALPQSADFPGLIALSENMAKTSSLTLKSMSQDSGGSAEPVKLQSSKPGAAVPPPAPEAVPYSYAVQGSYESFLKLLKSVENSARPMRVNSLQVSGTGSDLSVNLTGETYFQAAAELPYKTEKVK